MEEKTPKVIKRDGREVVFNEEKIKQAITAAMKKTEAGVDTDLINRIVENFKASKLFKEDKVAVESIQDFIENALMKSSRKEVAKEFILYREERSKVRRYKGKLMKAVASKLNAKAVVNQNANVDENSFGGRMGEAMSVVMKDMALNELFSKKSRENHLNNEIYIHDLDHAILGDHNCADGESWIKIKKEDIVEVIKIKDLASRINLGLSQQANLNNYQILARDGWTSLVSMTCRSTRPGEILYELKTRQGQKLRLTGDHRVPVIRDGKEVLSNVRDIKVGDKLISPSVNLTSEDISTVGINFLDFTDICPDLLIYNLTPLRYYLMYKYGINLSEYWKENNFVGNVNSKRMRAVDFKKLCEDYPIENDCLEQLTIKNNGGKHYYPLFIPYSTQLAKLYAYIYADGGVYINESRSTYQVTFTNTNEKLILDFVECWNSVFGTRLNVQYPNPNGTSPCIRVCSGSRLLVRLFKDYAGACKYGSGKISIPNFVMYGSDDIKRAYLGAYLDTDGCACVSSNKLTQISFHSSSKGNCEQIQLLLQGLGYSSTLKKTGNKGDLYRFGYKIGPRNFDTYSVYLAPSDTNDFLLTVDSVKTSDKPLRTGTSKFFDKHEIINITQSREDIPVYDMETGSHWYVINGYISHNCLSCPIDDLLAKGFTTRQTDIRPAGSINTAFQLVAVIFQIQSLQQFGRLNTAC